jgi:membrane-associated protease RseP (regulator of RpoE activity)
MEIPGIAAHLAAICLIWAAIHALLLFHELGHYFVGAGFETAISKVQVGIGPRLVGFQLGSVAWEWRLIPVLGFVQFDNPPEETELPQYYYVNKSKLQRVLVVLAGPIASVVTACVLFSASLLFFPEALPDRALVITSVVPGSRAAEVGLRQGDVLLLGRTPHEDYSTELEILSESSTWAVIMPDERHGFRHSATSPLLYDLDGVAVRHTFSRVLLVPTIKELLLPRERGVFRDTDAEVEAKTKPSNSSLGMWLELAKLSPGEACLHLALASLVIALINLLPIFPLDGGRVVSELFKGLVSDRVLVPLQVASLALLLGAILRLEVMGVIADVFQFWRGVNGQ